jgi:hypothetical protein
VESIEQCKNAIQELLASRLFSEAPVQSKLLSFLAERSLAGTADELKEYSIGVELFSKRESYSPQSDPSVRVQTSRLRSRLEEYYRTEGSESGIIVRLPKGSFTLVFDHRQADSERKAIAEQSGASASAEPAERPLWQRIAILTVFGVLLGAVAYEGLLVRQLKEEVQQGKLDSNVARLWQPLISSPRPLTLVVGMPLWMRLKGGYYRHISVSSPADIPDAAGVQRLFRLAGEKPDHLEFGFNGLGETMDAFLLGRLFLAARKPVTISRSNSLSWEDLRSQDVVLLGSSKANPHLRDMPILVNYRLVRGGIQVLHPAKGEPDAYHPTLNERDETVADYAIVARLPGIEGNGYITILGAESTSGNWAAGELMTDPRQAAQLVSKMADRQGNLPEFFELILRAEFQSMVPVKTSYVRHRVISRRPISQ